MIQGDGGGGIRFLGRNTDRISHWTAILHTPFKNLPPSTEKPHSKCSANISTWQLLGISHRHIACKLHKTNKKKKNEKKSGENRGWAVEKWAGHSTGAIKTDIRSKWAWPNRVKHYLEVWEKVFGKAIRDRWECNQPKKKNVRKSGKCNKLLRRVASVNLNAVQELEVCEIFKTLTALRYIAIRYYIF